MQNKYSFFRQIIYGSHLASKADEKILCSYLEQVLLSFGLPRLSDGLISGVFNIFHVYRNIMKLYGMQFFAEVIKSSRSMGKLLGLSEQDDIDLLRAEAGRRFIASIAAITGDHEPGGLNLTIFESKLSHSLLCLQLNISLLR